MITTYLLTLGVSRGITTFTTTFCSSTANSPEIDLGGIPFRHYRGRPPWNKFKKRPPQYYLLFRRARKAALHYRDGVPDPEPPPKSPRVRKQRKKPPRWGRQTPEEEQSNRADSYNRIKTKFLHDSFVMYEMQYGINLDEFVKGIDPLKTFRLTKPIIQMGEEISLTLQRWSTRPRTSS